MNLAWLFILGLPQFLLAEFSTVHLKELQLWLLNIEYKYSKYVMLLKPMENRWLKILFYNCFILIHQSNQFLYIENYMFC